MDDTALNKRPSIRHTERQQSTHVSFTLPQDPPAKPPAPGDPSPYKVNLSTEYSKALLVVSKSEKALKKAASKPPHKLSPIRGKEEGAQPTDPTFLTGMEPVWTAEQLKYIEQ